MKKMKTLVSARKSHDVSEEASRQKVIWSKFVRGEKCPYCRALLSGMSKKGHDNHLERCAKFLADGDRIDPDFPALGPLPRSVWRKVQSLKGAR